MLLRLAVALAAVGIAAGAYALWRRPPRRRLGRISLPELGVEGPAIVQFSSPSCAPCRAARPRLMEVADGAAVRYAQVDVVERPELARRYGIRSVPTIVVAGRDGRVLGVWTSLPENGEIGDIARRARAA